MKQILIIIYLLPLSFNGQIDTSLLKKNEINIVNQKKIKSLVEKYKKILKNKGGIEGWKIQITFKAKRENIIPVRNKFIDLYPNMEIETTFESPYYKLLVGNYRNRNEALKMQHHINKHFPGAHPIPKIIDKQLLK